MINTNLRSISRIMNHLEAQALRRNWGIKQLEKHLCKYHVLGESSNDGAEGEYWFRVIGEDEKELYTGNVSYDPQTGKIYSVKTVRKYDFEKKDFVKLQKALKKSLQDEDKKRISNSQGTVYISLTESEDFGETISFESLSTKYFGKLEFIHFYEQKNGIIPENYRVFKDGNIVDLDSDIIEELEWIFKNFIK